MTHSVRVLLVEKEKYLRDKYEDMLSKSGFAVFNISPQQESSKALANYDFDVALFGNISTGEDMINVYNSTCAKMPHIEAIIMLNQNEPDSLGSLCPLPYRCLPADASKREISNTLNSAATYKKMRMENIWLKKMQQEQPLNYSIDGKSEKIKALKSVIERAAPTNASILIHGESGVGKEYMARYVHQNGNHPEAPFITLNCKKYSGDEIENILFGQYQQGNGSIGYLSIIGSGTIYLDGVDKMPLSTQAKLLSLLETCIYRTSGGQTDLRSSARIIASTEVGISNLQNKRGFSMDLHYKLSSIAVTIPPLRERTEDISEIIKKFFKEKPSASNGKAISAKAINSMLKYRWPGNIRELLTIVEQAAKTSNGKSISGKDIRLPSSKKSNLSTTKATMSISDVEREHILFVLGETGGNISKSARILGISRPKLYRRITNYKNQ